MPALIHKHGFDRNGKPRITYHYKDGVVTYYYGSEVWANG